MNENTLLAIANISAIEPDRVAFLTINRSDIWINIKRTVSSSKTYFLENDDIILFDKTESILENNFPKSVLLQKEITHQENH
ncbi:hypothetical protein BFR40_10470 [Brochothrix thermosphacta]|uniref:hypothetical protein n=1 Tax=Brochothrix thermosphacta TaxID=2756 RepID=UPI00083FD3F5|nr:hypothetical protein [Brochothrix thermosphacta]ANZ97239.1 hypothetical protein BFC20_05640 [Brochothrix thermosphacta]ODJ48354.1 hypothetical protein BFR38_06105 [Brochothrix thermosphacta]ODJ49927.1 hypothetical protein BFR40_10470 [Brochothrix thermosphacta]ODJ54688.1 hypothetical protein BFR42_07150 [Brochothrix thermosphacta]ODJ68821.1 hypothetical protein BFR39_09170 [Brochothrix thermosphacta]